MFLLFNIISSNEAKANNYSNKTTFNLQLPDSSIIDTVEYIPVDTSSIVINSVAVEKVIMEFLDDAVKYKLDSNEVIEHIKHLDAILVTDIINEGKLGMTAFKVDSLAPYGVRGAILIDSSLLEDYDLFKLTLYHELGHWFSLEHYDCDNCIMMNKYLKKNTYKVIGYWDKSVKTLMKKIKKTRNRKEKRYILPEIPDSVRIKTVKFGALQCNH